MQTDLALLLMVLVVAFALATVIVCWAAARRVGRIGGSVQRLNGVIEDGRTVQRIADARTGAARAVAGSVALGQRLDRADAAMAATSDRLHTGRDSIDEATRERLLPLAQWAARVVAIGRLWRMQREMWRG